MAKDKSIIFMRHCKRCGSIFKTVYKRGSICDDCFCKTYKKRININK